MLTILRNATITISLDNRTAALADRYLTILEGRQQAEIDALTARVKASNKVLASAVNSSTN